MFTERTRKKVYEYEQTRTTEFIKKIVKIIYYFGSPNYWFEDLEVPSFVLKNQHLFSKFLHILVLSTIVAMFASFATQHELSDKQQSDLPLFSCAYILFYLFVASVAYYADVVRAVMLKMMVQLKEVHNDAETEEHFIQQSKFFIKLYLGIYIGVLMLYGLDSLANMLLTGSTFVTMVTFWPDVHDYSTVANVARVVIYMIWVIEMFWFASVYVLAIPVTIGISHQYKNLGHYFESLNSIFESDGDHKQKELKYEDALKVGIKAHIDTLWCRNSVQEIFSILYGGQIIHNVMSLIVLMYQFTKTERTLSMVITIVVTAASLLISTGCLMWKAGDVTFEAAGLPTAIFGSGWQHCGRGTSLRIRPLVVIAMAVAQIPVEFQGLGIINFSYDSYVNICKSSYSVFSVLY